MKLLCKLIAFALVACLTFTAVAQPPEGGPPDREGGRRGRREGREGREGRGGPGGPGGPGGFGRPQDMMRMLPIFAALDADEDGELSAEEIENATVALKKIDKNNDGRLTEEELRPEFGRREGREGRGGGPREEGRFGDRRGRRSPEDMVRRFMAYDKNEDGKLTKDEMPEQLERMFTRLDSDENGEVTEDELKKVAEAFGQGGERGGARGERGERGARGDRGGRGDRDGGGEGNRPRRPARPE